MLFNIGRVCIKIAGRDAGKHCVVIDHIDENTVLIAGETRRRNVNIRHLEPLEKTVKISKGASDAVLGKAMEEAGFALMQTKAKKPAARARKAHATKEKPVKEKKSGSAKKATPEKVSKAKPSAEKPAPQKEEAKPAPAEKK
ncbi:MAG: 50S ribosomal protein L14e [Candidatus Woesearchaeota archaeon]|nr:MAG: 50S ribosomal protein L14e [Candidatus Woesearchaeota archaeon]